MLDDDLNADAVDVTELLVSTADHGNAGLDPCVHEVLQLVRDKRGLQAVFVRASQPDGRRDRFMADGPPCHPLEAAWGEHVLAESLPAADAASHIHQSTPVALPDGSVYGTLCVCSRGQWTAQSDFTLLRSTAMLIAQRIDQGRRPLAAGRTRWANLRAVAGARPRFEREQTRP